LHVDDIKYQISKKDKEKDKEKEKDKDFITKIIGVVQDHFFRKKH